jgi:hypothetical protein
VRVSGTMKSDTAPSTVREQLKEKLLSKRMLASIQAPSAGTETMEGYSGSREQHASQHAAARLPARPERDQDLALQAHAEDSQDDDDDDVCVLTLCDDGLVEDEEHERARERERELTRKRREKEQKEREQREQQEQERAAKLRRLEVAQRLQR